MTYYNQVFRSAKEGRFEGSYDQQTHIRLYSEGGQPGGRGSLSPASIFPITSLFLTPWNGLIPNMRISQIHTPRDTEKITINVKKYTQSRITLNCVVHLDFWTFRFMSRVHFCYDKTEPPRGKTNNLHRRKQRRRSASR